MTVKAPQFVIGPFLQAGQNLRIDPNEKRFSLCHDY